VAQVVLAVDVVLVAAVQVVVPVVRAVTVKFRSNRITKKKISKSRA
jgi:hypothetical protein